jgi:hypothetical protein
MGKFAPSAFGISKVTVTAVDAASYTAKLTDDIIKVIRTATGTCTVTLPSALCSNGRIISVKDAGGNASVNNITVATEGSETVDGDATKDIVGDYDSLDLFSDGFNWFIF